MKLADMKLATVVLVYAFVARTEGLWENRKVNCGVSVWAKWGPWSAPAPGGNRSRSRTIIRKPKNGGRLCPSLTDSQNRQDPWSRGKVAKKLNNNFMSGHTTRYKFVPNIAIPRGIAGGAGGLRARVSFPGGRARGPPSSGGGGGARVDGDGLTLLPRDLLFLIDMSGSISKSEWTSTKQALVKLIKKICGTIGKNNDNNRIAIITFSTKVILNFDFRTHWTIASVSRAILNMHQARGATCTGKALDYAHKYMFDPSKGIRPATESVKDVLVLTDGRSNCGAKLAETVKQLHVKAFVYALAIGKYDAAGKAEIESMVSRPLIDHIFSVANFIEFKKMVAFIYSYPEFTECAPLEQ